MVRPRRRASPGHGAGYVTQSDTVSFAKTPPRSPTRHSAGALMRGCTWSDRVESDVGSAERPSD